MQIATNQSVQSAGHPPFTRQLNRRQPAIPAATIQAVKGASDVVAVIGEHIGLRRSGKNFHGRCPWHSSKSGRSFVVYAEQKTWRCWSCGIGGDVFEFLHRLHGFTFVDSVAHLARRSRIDIGKPPSPEVARRVAATRELAEIDRKFRDASRIELLRLGRELDDSRRLYCAASSRLAQIEAGAAIRFDGEQELVWEAMRLAIEEQRDADVGYAIVAFGTASERDAWVVGSSADRERMIASALAKGYVKSEKGIRHGVPA